MANVKISALNDAATLDGTEEVPIVQTGATVKTTTQDIADLGGGIGLWNASVQYQSGQIAIDRGGFWIAAFANNNSRPISGNSNWTLVSGEPYVDTVLNPSDLTSAPFKAADIITEPFLELVPKSSDNNLITIPTSFTLEGSAGNAWSGNCNLYIGWLTFTGIGLLYPSEVPYELGLPSGGLQPVQVNVDGSGTSFVLNIGTSILATGVKNAYYVPVMHEYFWDSDPDTTVQSIVARGIGPMSGGTQSLRIRTYYRFESVNTF